MKAAVAFLLPLLGHARFVAHEQSLDLKRDGLTFQDAASICYVYSTTYLEVSTVTVPGVPSGKSALDTNLADPRTRCPGDTPI